MKDNVILIRTSTEEQNPENQLKDCIYLNSKLGHGDYEVIEEKLSGYKDIEREGLDKVINAIKSGEVKQLIVWDLDRLYRNRKKLVAFFELCKMYKCKIYSHNQDWLENLHKIPEPFNEIMHSLMIQLMGWLGEDESKKKSNRVKIAVRKETGITLSYKGNKWGRRNISEKTKQEIVECYKQNKTYSQICSEVFYWNRNNNKKYVSKGLVHKILKEFKENNNRLDRVQELNK